MDNLSMILEIGGETVEQMRLLQASVFSGDWRRHYDSVAVLRRDQLDSKPTYVVELRKKGLPSVTLRVDAETGDVLELATMVILPGGAGRIPSTTRFEDYRVVDGVRLSFRQVDSNEHMGRTVYEVERIELDLEVDEELFTLRPAEPAIEATTAVLPMASYACASLPNRCAMASAGSSGTSTGFTSRGTTTGGVARTDAP